MKLVYFMIFIVILTGCGGGGGVMDMSTPTPPVVDDSAKMELAADLAAARTTIANLNISAAKQMELEDRIDALEGFLATAEETIEALRMSLAEIMQEIQNIKSPSPPDTPTAAECHAQSQILVGDNCQSCPTNMQFSENQCVEIPPTADECHAMQKILVADSCQSCPTNMEFNINQCVVIPPTADDCYAEEKILVADNCQSCPPNMRFSVNQCIPTAAFCHAQSQILVGDNCQSCPPNMEFNINQCILTAAFCHAQSKILVGDSCQSCPTNRNFVINRCVSIFDTAEYQAHPMYESIEPLYAYERGHFGQNVTVVVIEPNHSFLIDHPDLAANYITTTIEGIGDWRLTTTDPSDNFHAAVVAAAIGAVRNSIGIHGIAPEVKIIPMGPPRINESIPFATYLRDNNIPIINNSYGASSSRPLSVRLTLLGPINSARSHERIYGDTEAIWVWSAGNEGYNEPNQDPILPLINENLITNWIVAIALSANLKIASYSNRCGSAKDWCVAASVYDASFPTQNGGYRKAGFVGTSFAAPQVSGALAIFYGAIGIQSPQMARMILLTTATDIGDPGIDEVYGWGLVNISAGIVMIENMASAGTDELSAVPFANLRGELPSGFAHLHNELSAIKLAIKLTTDLYYNVALSEMLTPGDAPNMPLGDAAAEMLENRGEETRRGIFAYGDINQEIGIRYYGGGNGYSYIAEGTQSATNNFSGNFGGIGKISGKTYGGKFGFTKAIKAGIKVFADYERAKIIGKGEEGNLIKGARNARAESWAAGISFTDIWKYGDRIRLSANQEMKLSGGDLIIRYPHAVGDFHKTFTGEESQKIEIRETFLPLKQKALMRYTAGYSQKFTAKSEWAAALEYNAGNNAKALSLIWQGEF